jgi:hypothetical protein
MTSSHQESKIDEHVSGQRAAVIKLSYRQIFRPVFVLFCLYAAGEIFYRGDGLMYYYASFPEIIPTIALVVIFYSVAAVFSSILIWITQRILGRVIQQIGWNGKVERWLLFTGLFILSGSLVWTVFEYTIYHSTTLKEKRTVFAFISLSLILMTLSLVVSNKGQKWIGIIQKPITPLVWLFGIIAALSILLLVSHVF